MNKIPATGTGFIKYHDRVLCFKKEDGYDLSDEIEIFNPMKIMHLDVWFAGLDKPNLTNILSHIRRIMRADDTPITLFPDGRIFDGYHRILRCLLVGKQIKARRLKTFPPVINHLPFAVFQTMYPAFAKILEECEKAYD